MKFGFYHKLQDYTESEFRRFLDEFFEATETNNLPDSEYDKYISKLTKHFSDIVEHPEGNGLIYHPAASREDSVDGVIEELESWYKQQGKDCFKDE